MLRSSRPRGDHGRQAAGRGTARRRRRRGTGVRRRAPDRVRRGPGTAGSRPARASAGPPRSVGCQEDQRDRTEAGPRVQITRLGGRGEEPAKGRRGGPGARGAWGLGRGGRLGLGFPACRVYRLATAGQDRGLRCGCAVRLPIRTPHSDHRAVVAGRHPAPSGPRTTKITVRGTTAQSDCPSAPRTAIIAVARDARRAARGRRPGTGAVARAERAPEILSYPSGSMTVIRGSG